MGVKFIMCRQISAAKEQVKSKVLADKGSTAAPCHFDASVSTAAHECVCD